MRGSMLLCLGVLAGCQQPPAEDPKIASVKASVSRKLKDPLSAQWRAINVKPNGAICGEVNAKNEFGGYPGFKRFVEVPVFLNGRTDVNPDAGTFLEGADNTTMAAGQLRIVDAFEMSEIYCEGRSRAAVKKDMEAFKAMAGS